MCLSQIFSKPDLKNPQNSIFIISVDHGIPGSYYDNVTIMANYTDTLVQMYGIVWDQGQSQIRSSNGSAQYVETAKKVIKLERELMKASDQIVSPNLRKMIRATKK